MRFWVRANGVDLPLSDHQTLIGRSEECKIRIKESLVSRRHARIVHEDGAVVLQDLGSANGVYVNQERVTDSVVLKSGDQIFIGTCELLLFEDVDGEDRITDSGVRSEPPERHTPVTSCKPGAVIYPSGRPAALDEDVETERSTRQHLEFEHLGRLADKMFAMGRIEAARQILEPPLRAIADTARSGEGVDNTLVDTAGRYALRLAAETLAPKWVDLAVELHIACRRPMTEENAQRLASLRAKAPLGSADLLKRYTRLLQTMMAGLSPAERIIVQRIACLAPDAG